MRLHGWKRFGLWAALLLVVVFGVMFASGGGAAVAAQISKVFVTNTAADPVPASIVGNPTVTISGTPSVSVANSPTVTISGTPTVQPVETPFQEFVAASSSGSEACDTIDVPSGKTLTIDSFSADVDGQRQPDVYLLTTVSAPGGGGGNFVRSVRLALRSSVDQTSWSGDVETKLFSGNANDPSGVTYSYRACIFATDTQGTFLADFRGFVSGTLS